MRVLMLGWEFPPDKSGGLGTACYGITQALLRKGTDVLFIMPQTRLTEHPESHVRLRSASGTLIPVVSRSEPEAEGPTAAPDSRSQNGTRPRQNSSIAELQRFAARMVVRGIRSSLRPYDSAASYEQRLARHGKGRRTSSAAGGKNEIFRRLGLPQLGGSVWPADAAAAVSQPQDAPVRWKPVEIHGGYGQDLMSEVYRYSLAAAQIAREEEFDVIHVHDWMTYPAGILIKQITGKPLIAHIHALEHDRSGENVNPEIAHIEWAGMTAADRVVAVSYYTKNKVMRLYRIPDEKIDVVHNAVNRNESQLGWRSIPPHREKRVLFMGRITYQKGPDYFVEAARLVHERMPDVHFVMAGSGDMFYRMVRRIAQLGMGTAFHFPGFQSGVNVERMYASCDLYVMPSVSEPFGIAPLEAMICDTPVILSRQSGVAEVVRNALKVDFWDVQEMANKICAVLAYPKLAEAMVKNSREDLRCIRWSEAADRLNAIYRDCIRRS